MLKNFVVAIAATGIALSSTAAFAREPTPAPAASRPAPEANTRYCLRQEATTGSIIEKRVCKTLDQWRAQGIDPTQKPKN